MLKWRLRLWLPLVRVINPGNRRQFCRERLVSLWRHFVTSIRPHHADWKFGSLISWHGLGAYSSVVLLGRTRLIRDNITRDSDLDLVPNRNRRLARRHRIRRRPEGWPKRSAVLRAHAIRRVLKSFFSIISSDFSFFTLIYVFILYSPPPV